MPRTKLDQLKRKKVEVRASGMTYRGILLEVTEEEITLRTETRIISISMANVTSVTDPADKKLNDAPRFVDPSFFSDDGEN